MCYSFIFKITLKYSLSFECILTQGTDLCDDDDDDDDDDKLYLTTLTLSAKAGFHNGRVKYKYVFTSK